MFLKLEANKLAILVLSFNPLMAIGHYDISILMM